MIHQEKLFCNYRVSVARYRWPLTPSLPSSRDRGPGEIPVHPRGRLHTFPDPQTNINLYCRSILNLKYTSILQVEARSCSSEIECPANQRILLHNIYGGFNVVRV